jgi:nucleotide-binding universal stress UspA family protein
MEIPRIFLVLVDETREMSVALRYASMRAKAVNGQVALIHVTPPMGMQLWRAVEEQVAFEARREAETRLQMIATQSQEMSGRMAIYHLREGNVREELLRLLEEDHNISVLVLAAAKGQQGPGAMVNYLSGRGMSRLKMPFVVVPEDYVEGRAED